MAEDMKPAGQSVLNPLWIISLFLGLSETVVGVLAMQVRGWIQVALALFATLFPFGVAAAFFWIVWRKPYVLYAPRDYPAQTSVTAFVDAMTFKRPDQSDAIETSVRAALESVIARLVPPETPIEEREDAVENAVATASETFRSMVVLFRIEIDSAIRALFEIFITPDTTLDGLVEQLEGLLEPYGVPKGTYGYRWYMRNSDNVRIRLIGGSRWSPHGKASTVDDRHPKEVDIRSGSVCTIRVRQPEHEEESHAVSEA